MIWLVLLINKLRFVRGFLRLFLNGMLNNVTCFIIEVGVELKKQRQREQFDEGRGVGAEL